MMAFTINKAVHQFQKGSVQSWGRYLYIIGIDTEIFKKPPPLCSRQTDHSSPTLLKHIVTQHLVGFLLQLYLKKEPKSKGSHCGALLVF